MIPRLRVATHISIALAMMAASLVLLAHAIGLAPNPLRDRIESREMIARLVSDCALQASQANDFARMAGVAHELVESNSDVLSIGLRLSDGRLAFATEEHRALWSGESELMPGPHEARIPVLRDGTPYAQVEIRFDNGPANAMLALLAHPVAPLVLFVGCAGFLAYRFYLRHVLQYLDPAAVIPERVRLVLDSLAEAVLILDADERVVLANRAWLRIMDADLEETIGRRASSFDWCDPTTGAHDRPPPWIETLGDGVPRSAVRLGLASPALGRRLLSVTSAPILGPDGVRRGVLVTLSDLTESEAQRGELEDLLRNLARSRGEIERQNAELTRLAAIDSLTQCFNRRELFERAKKYWALARRTHRPLACVMIDVDHFKQINDTHGHQAGDSVLAHIGPLIRGSVREQDVAGRFGGEEFCVLLPETDTEDAEALAERIRAAIETGAVAGAAVTVSAGVAVSTGTSSVEDLLERADQALYQAKRTGRNRVCVAPLTPPEMRSVA